MAYGAFITGDERGYSVYYCEFASNGQKIWEHREYGPVVTKEFAADWLHSRNWTFEKMTASDSGKTFWWYQRKRVLVGFGSGFPQSL